MKTLYPLTLIFLFSLSLSAFEIRDKKKDPKPVSTSAKSNTNNESSDRVVVDTEILNDFFTRYDDLKKYKKEVNELYKNRSYDAIWYKNNKVTDFGKVLYQKLKLTDEEGLDIEIPYESEIDKIFNKRQSKKVSKSDSDMLLSAAYLIYMKNVYEGIDAESVKKTGWMVPKKKLSYTTMLDSLISDPDLMQTKNVLLIDQYYKLQDALKKYRKIEHDHLWKTITTESPYQDLRPDANSPVIGQVRNRLFVIGDLKKDSKSNFYDRELMDGVMKYKLRNGFKPNYIIAEEHIKDLNTPISDKIKTLMINMERCRWISPQIVNNNTYIMVNVPSFELDYVKNGKKELVSQVFVGAQLTKTPIFSGDIDRVVFSPYWTVPQSIVDNELKLKIAADKNYLADHNMEMVNGQVRQKPGPENSLGLVKFMFPNPDDIYMHDTPSKTLFDFEKRTFSHGCINVKKAKELAVALLKDYPEWNSSKIDQAMDGKKETTFKLKNTVPIYICYFTTWVNDDGEIGFFQDVYDRDTELNKILFTQETEI